MRHDADNQIKLFILNWTFPTGQRKKKYIDIEERKEEKKVMKRRQQCDIRFSSRCWATWTNNLHKLAISLGEQTSVKNRAGLARKLRNSVKTLFQSSRKLVLTLSHLYRLSRGSRGSSRNTSRNSNDKEPESTKQLWLLGMARYDNINDIYFLVRSCCCFCFCCSSCSCYSLNFVGSIFCFPQPF